MFDVFPITQIKAHWARSKGFRVALIAAVIFAVLRLLLALALLLMPVPPDTEAMLEEDPYLGTPGDLLAYVRAAQDMSARADLYPEPPIDTMEFYQYSPAYALAFTPLLALPPVLLSVLMTLAHVVVYALLYGVWCRLFRRWEMADAYDQMARLLPVWLIFTAFWSDLSYLNVYVLMALLATLLLDAVMREDLAGAVIWISVIVQMKPQWAFAAAIPLILGRWRFFLKMLGISALVYAGVALLTAIIAGPAYIAEQYGDYVRTLIAIGSSHGWRTAAEHGFLGYNHAVKQIVIYLLGKTDAAFLLATVLKVVLLIPLGLAALKQIRQPLGKPGEDVPRYALFWGFVLYLGAFIWLDVVWEAMFAIVIFTYLLSILENRAARVAAWAVMLPYAFIDIIQILSFLILGEDVIIPGPYVITDPSLYLPLVMIVILTFYAILLWLALRRASLQNST